MAKKSSMSIGNIINAIPSMRRKQKAPSRLDMVKKGLTKAGPGQVLPIYMGSTYAANSLAMLLRKSGLMKQVVGQVAVRKHIVYVQKQQTPATEDTAVTPTPEPAPELTTTTTA